MQLTESGGACESRLMRRNHAGSYSRIGRLVLCCGAFLLQFPLQLGSIDVLHGPALVFFMHHL